LPIPQQSVTEQEQEAAEEPGPPSPPGPDPHIPSTAKVGNVPLIFNSREYFMALLLVFRCQHRAAGVKRILQHLQCSAVQYSAVHTAVVVQCSTWPARLTLGQRRRLPAPAPA
jgi:hypothetical protein